MPDQDKILRVILKYTSDEATVKEVTDEIKAIEAAEKKATVQAEAMRQKLEQMQQVSEKLASVSTIITGIGAAIAGPFMAAAKAYVDKAGQSEEVSRRWLAATERQQKALMEIGKISAEAILPMLEKTAAIAEKAAEFAKAHPGVIEAAVKVGTAVATVGAIGIAVSQGIRLIADVKMLAATAQQLLAGKMMQDAANKQLAAAGGMGKIGGLGKLGGLGLVGAGFGATMAGAAAGGLAYEGLRSAGIAKGASLGQFAAVAAMGAGRILTGDEKKALEWFKAVGQATGAIAKDAPKAEAAIKGLNKSLGEITTQTQRTTRAAGAVSLPGAEVVMGTRKYKRGERSARERQEAAKAAREEVQQEREERARVIIEARQEEMRAEIEYQSNRAKIIRDYQAEILQAEQQHAIDMRRIKEDANLRMTDAAQKRDAISWLQEWRNSKTQQTRAEEDYQQQQSARKTQMQAQLKDLQDNLNQEQAIRKLGYQGLLENARDFTNQLKSLVTGHSGGSTRQTNVTYSPSYQVSSHDAIGAARQIQMLDNRLLSFFRP